jgi:hypothetical protein
LTIVEDLSADVAFYFFQEDLEEIETLRNFLFGIVEGLLKVDQEVVDEGIKLPLDALDDVGIVCSLKDVAEVGRNDDLVIEF